MYFSHKFSGNLLRLNYRWLHRCSCGGNQLIDLINEMGGNQVKIRQAADLCVGIRIILFKKNSKVMSKALMFYLRGKILEKLCGCAL